MKRILAFVPLVLALSLIPASVTDAGASSSRAPALAFEPTAVQTQDVVEIPSTDDEIHELRLFQSRARALHVFHQAEEAQSRARHAHPVRAVQAARDAAWSDWDNLASCESNNNWQINTGNGFEGGIQFTQNTWLSFGGGQFAQHAYNATRVQQIEIGEKVLAAQGRRAWPACSAAGRW